MLHRKSRPSYDRRTRGLPSGFTLVEVIVALTLLAMSVLVISRAFLTLMQVTYRGGNQTVATSLAVRKLEEIRARPEGQGRYDAWATEWANIVNEGPTPFPAPFGNYEYQVVVNAVTTSPATPAWLTDPPYHENSIKWITVRVTYRGGPDPLAVVSSAVIREMYRGP
ncbi:MAG: prepilin-type N-terminal cleavage/methylation domain-containing protein [Armatimonadota bacterium]|nr:prepilin-type N-terminal cleavage/methylation domain-containing protein [Armatimonadota bacterium]